MRKDGARLDAVIIFIKFFCVKNTGRNKVYISIK